jgi:hypothetical protein
MGKVYLIANGEWTQFKIGVSTKKSMDERLKSLKTGNGSDLIVVKTFETKYHFKVERILHLKYHYKRLNGEWFALNDDDINNFINECQKANDSFEFLEKNNNPFF